MQTFAERFFREGGTVLEYEKDATGRPLTITTLEQLAQHVSRAIIVKAKAAVLDTREAQASRHSRLDLIEHNKVVTLAP